MFASYILANRPHRTLHTLLSSLFVVGAVALVNIHKGVVYFGYFIQALWPFSLSVRLVRRKEIQVGTDLAAICIVQCSLLKGPMIFFSFCFQCYDGGIAVGVEGALRWAFVARSLRGQDHGRGHRNHRSRANRARIGSGSPLRACNEVVPYELLPHDGRISSHPECSFLSSPALHVGNCVTFSEPRLSHN